MERNATDWLGFLFRCLLSNQFCKYSRLPAEFRSRLLPYSLYSSGFISYVFRIYTCYFIKYYLFLTDIIHHYPQYGRPLSKATPIIEKNNIFTMFLKIMIQNGGAYAPRGELPFPTEGSFSNRFVFQTVSWLIECHCVTTSDNGCQLSPYCNPLVFLTKTRVFPR